MLSMHKPASMLLALMGVGIVAYSISLDGTSKPQPPTERTIEVARAPRAQPIIQPTPTAISLSRPESARDRIDYQQPIVVPDDAVSLVRRFSGSYVVSAATTVRSMAFGPRQAEWQRRYLQNGSMPSCRLTNRTQSC